MLADYIARGFHVLRLEGKNPDGRYAPHGVHSAACSYEPWESAPNANIGIAIGVGPLEHVRVLDIDPKNGGSLDVLPGTVPKTPQQRTGSGGWHFLLRWSGPRPRTKLLPGVELLGPGRYFVAAPSVHPNGRRYEWVEWPDVEIADAPEWLVELGLKRDSRPPRPKGEIAFAAKYARAVLINAVSRVETACDGERNNVLFRETVQAASFLDALGEDLLANAMIDAAMVAGLREYEAERTVMSAIRRSR